MLVAWQRAVKGQDDRPGAVGDRLDGLGRAPDLGHARQKDEDMTLVGSVVQSFGHGAGDGLGIRPVAEQIGEPKDGDQQFAEVESAAATEHEIITVCTASPKGMAHGALAISRDGAAWRVQGTHGGQTVNLTLTGADTGRPTVTV